jgi:PAS domain S-box-containing protein
LRESEERYRALFERSLDCVYIHDFEGRFLDANDATLNLLGYTREEIADLNFTSMLSEDQLPLASKTLQEIRETGFQKDMTEYRLRLRNGSEVYLEIKGAAILSKGTYTAIQAVARNITERKKAEANLVGSAERNRENRENRRLGIRCRNIDPDLDRGNLPHP